MKKNVWIFNHYAEPPQYETRVRNNMMAKYLMQAGYDVTIFGASTIHNTNINLITDGSPYIRREYDGLKFVHIKAPDYTGNGLSRKLNLLLFPFHLWQVTRKLGEKPDVIVNDLDVMAMSFPFWIAHHFRVPIITEVRDLWPESLIEFGYLKRNSLLARFLYQVEKRMYLRSDSIVFSMDGGYDYIRERNWEKSIPRSKVEFINNGVDLEQFDYNKEHFRVEDPDLDDPSTFKAIYTGSVRPANNPDLLIDCAKYLLPYPDIRLLIYGGGENLDELREVCKENGLKNCIFKGPVPKQNIPYILSKGDLNLLNYDLKSVGVFKYGSSQNKLFDYMASGQPILSNVSIAYSLIQKYHCGQDDTLPDAETYSRAVLAFYHMDEEQRRLMGANARRAAEEYDFKRLTDKLIAVIENIPEKQPSRIS